MSRTVIIAPHAREATLDFARDHIKSANRCPALRGERAEYSGEAWARTLAREMKAGTFTHVDGEPCLIELPESFGPTKPPEHEQMTLGEEAA